MFSFLFLASAKMCGDMVIPTVVLASFFLEVTRVKVNTSLECFCLKSRSFMANTFVFSIKKDGKLAFFAPPGREITQILPKPIRDQFSSRFSAPQKGYATAAKRNLHDTLFKFSAAFWTFLNFIHACHLSLVSSH